VATNCECVNESRLARDARRAIGSLRKKQDTPPTGYRSATATSTPTHQMQDGLLPLNFCVARALDPAFAPRTLGPIH
jgi:hypothetical protein